MPSPFKFLDAYTKEDKDIFFGRENEVEELYQKVFDSEVLLVCGVSGTGKTSLINCGLANKFEESDWLPINIRRGSDITASLKTGISKSAITPTKEKHSIVQQLQSLYLDHFKPIYLIFDQFEEVFIFGNREERKEFITEIKKIIESDVQCRLLFVMREESLAGAIEFEREIPTFLTNRMRIEKMTWHNAKQVIEEPCKVHGIEVEEDLSENILGKLNPESIEVELTYLQVLLDKIFHLAVDRNIEKPVFTNKLLSEVGDVSDLLGSFLEEQISQLEDPDIGLIILKSFVSVKGTKRQITTDDVIDFARALGKDIPENELISLIQKFVSLRILRDKDESGRYELRHDMLASKIYEKITLVEKELLEVYQFIESAYTNYEKRNILLSKKDFKYISPYEDKLFLKQDLQAFIAKSRKSLERTQKKIRSITITAAVCILIISTGIIFRVYHIPGGGLIKLLGFTLYLGWFIPRLSFFTIKSKEDRGYKLLILIFSMIFIVLIYVASKPREHWTDSILLVGYKITSLTTDIQAKNNRMYEQLEFQFSSNADIIAIHEQTIKEIKQKSNELHEYINAIKIELVKSIDGPYCDAIAGDSLIISYIMSKDDMSKVVEIMIGPNFNGTAYDLKPAIESYREFLISLMVADDEFIINQINKWLNTYDPPVTEKHGRLTWEEEHFAHSPLIAVITVLSQMQQNIRLAEGEVLDHLLDEVHNDK